MRANEFNNGSVRISNDIIILISARATTEVEGVYSLAGMEKNESLKKVHTNQIKGVEIEIDQNSLMINVSIIVLEGYNVNIVAREVQENITEQIKLMTGLNVDCVNILVEGLRI